MKMLHFKSLPISCFRVCFWRLILDTVEETCKTNILQMFALTKFALPHLKKGSSIINTTSVVAYRGSPAMIDYAATKGAIVSFTRSLAKQLTPKGIRVNAVAPGPVSPPFPVPFPFPLFCLCLFPPPPFPRPSSSTGIWRKVHTPLQPASRDAEEMESFGEHTMLGRPAQPSEVKSPEFVYWFRLRRRLFSLLVLRRHFIVGPLFIPVRKYWISKRWNMQWDGRWLNEMDGGLKGIWQHTVLVVRKVYMSFKKYT